MNQSAVPDVSPATLEVVATSSDSTFSHTVSGSVATFRFVGIDLPPNVSAPEGQGFITFQVTPDAGLPIGTVIENEASIVFDFNPPIATPTVVHEIRQAARARMEGAGADERRLLQEAVEMALAAYGGSGTLDGR